MQDLLIAAEVSQQDGDTASTSQGNGQSSHQQPIQYIVNMFRISWASFIGVLPVQKMPSTFAVFQVM